MVKVLCDFPVFENAEHDLTNYDLSYDFIRSKIGIYACECYPIKNGFQIIDEDKNHYLLFRIKNNEFYKYKVVYNVLEKLKNKNTNILSMYSANNEKYFFDSECGDWYLVFNFGNGNFKKFNEFKISDIKYNLKNFYNSSKEILKISDKFSNYKNEIRIIDNCVNDILRIEKIISLGCRENLHRMPYLNYKESIIENLDKARKFFLSKEYVYYYDDVENLRFIHGNLSNKSFIYENEKYFLGNFLNLSVGSVIEDISILITNMRYEIETKDLENILRELILDFDFKKDFHMKTLLNYLVIHSSIRGKYFSNEDFENDNLKFNNFAKKISFT